MPAALCIGESPTYWDSLIIVPNSITYSLIIATVFLFGFIVYLNFTTKSRNVKINELEYLNKAKEDSKNGVNPTYVIPGSIHYSIIYLFVNFISSNYFYAAFFYIYLAFDNDIFACYLQWYSPGAPLYGNLGFIYLAIGIVFLLLIFYYYRPMTVKKHVIHFSDVLELLVNFEEKKEELNILYIDAFDGFRPLNIAFDLKERNKNKSFPNFKMDVADKYGNTPGTIDIDVNILKRNSILLGLSDGTCVSNIITLPPAKDNLDENIINLSQFSSDSYDYILSGNYLVQSTMLKLTNTLDPIIVWNRIKILFAELHRVLKPSGYVVIHVDSLDKCEKFRGAFKACNYLSSVKIHPATQEMLSSESYTIIAIKKPIDDDDGKDSITIRDTVASNLIKTNSSNILSKDECHKIWLQFILINMIIFAMVVFITTHFFNSFLFPIEAGMGNYFVYNLIAIVTSTPLLLLTGLYLLRESILGTYLSNSLSF
jgi:hypothetical protein